MNGLSFYHQEQRPWGGFEQFTLNETSTVKIITVSPGEELSLQRHTKRKEFWKIISGNGFVTIGTAEPKVASSGDMFMIDTHEIHQVKGGTETLTFLEIAFGEFDESDIERLHDKYGRS